MRNILMLFLTIGLLVSSISCGDEIIDYIIYTDIRYVNETEVSPIQLDFYCGQEMKLSVMVNSNDTTFVASEINDYRWMPPDCP